MLRSQIAAMAAAGAMSVAVPAHALTVNDGVASCVACVDPSDLTTGDSYLVTNGDFLDANGVQFDVLVEIIDDQTSPGGNVGFFNKKGVPGYVHLRLTTQKDGAPFNPLGLAHVLIEDIDSNSGQNFTEYAGVNLPIVSAGSALATADSTTATGLGFIGGVLSGFNYAYLAPIPGADDGNRWRALDNVLNPPTHTAKFDIQGSNSFDFVWGSSTTWNNDGLVRGWEVTFDVQDPAPIPLPAGAWFALTGLAALLGLRRRRAA
jgi:hypothetical protein